MSDIHNALRRTWLSRALTRALGDMKGATGIERFGETLTPTIDLWELADWSYLRNERLVGMANLNQGAVVGQLGAAILNNPAGSGLIVTIDYVTSDIVSNMGFTLSSAVLVTGAAAGVPGAVRDTRWAAASGNNFNNTGLVVTKNSEAGISINTVLSTSVVSQIFTMPGFVLTPGFAFVVEGTVVNTAINVRMMWRERKAVPGELD